MSTSALTVQQRHLALPDCAYFAPSELAIPDSISKERFVELAKGLSRIDSANDFWLADAANFSTRWTDGLDLTAKATGRTKYHLVRVAQVAERFSPAKRFSYTVAHLRWLMPFPDEFLDRFLPSAANLNLSVKALRARAENEFGENPYKPKNPKKRNVPLRADLWARLSEHAPTKVSALIEQILSDWLKSHQTDADYAEKRRADNAERQRRWKAKHKNPAATTYHDDKQHPFAPTATVGARPSSGNDKQSTSAQPKKTAAPESPKPSRWRSFSEAREYVRGLHLSGSSEWQSWSASEARPRDIPSAPQVIYAGQWIDYADWLGKSAVLTVEKSRKHKPCQCKINSAYVTCTGKPLSSKLKPTWFVDREAAEQGNREFEACHGYLERIVYCKVCLAWHLQHVFSGEALAA